MTKIKQTINEIELGNNDLNIYVIYIYVETQITGQYVNYKYTGSKLPAEPGSWEVSQAFILQVI